MHSLAFSIKRVHLSLLAVQRNLLRALQITPARVDMLFVISQLGQGDERVMLQSDLWRALGVRRSTACRMLNALEDDGYVERGRGFKDLRQRRVWLTAKARVLLLRVEQIAFRFRFALYLAFGKFPGELRALNETLNVLRRRFDRATYTRFPWIVTMRWPFPEGPPLRKAA